MTQKKSLFLVFEGLDGSGKTTQCKWLAEWFQQQGREVVLTREPTDQPWGQKIRQLARTGKASLEEELEWFIQDRKQHIQEVIQPALQQNKVVIQDRYYFSTMAYQGAKGADPQKIFAMHQSFAPTPDKVFFLDIPVELGLKRIVHSRQSQLDAFENEERLSKSKQIFDSLLLPYLCKIDATQKEIDVHQQILQWLSD